MSIALPPGPHAPAGARLRLGGCEFALHARTPPDRLPPALADLDVPSADEPRARWSIRLVPPVRGASAPRPPLLGFSLEPRARTIRFPRAAIRDAAPFLHEAMLAALRLQGRLSLHAAAVAEQGAGALLLVAGSGCGKSSLTWQCLLRGGRVVSDDLVGLYRDARGRLALCPLRRTIAVSEELLAGRVLAGGAWEEQPGGRKLRFDPLALRAGARVDPAAPRRIAFLERGPARRIRSLTPVETLERLCAHTPAAWAAPTAREGIGLLRALAQEAPAQVATLTQACLADEAVLDALLA